MSLLAEAEGSTHKQKMNDLSMQEIKIKEDIRNWEEALNEQARTHDANVKRKMAEIEVKEKSIRAISTQIEKLAKFAGQVTTISRETSRASDQLRKSLSQVQEVKKLISSRKISSI